MANISNTEAEAKPESGSEASSSEAVQTGECSKTTSTDENKTNSCTNNEEEDKEGKVEFKVIFNKKKIDVAFSEKATIGELKSHLQVICYLLYEYNPHINFFYLL